MRARGYEVVVGECTDGSGHISAPAAERAAELMSMLTDPMVHSAGRSELTGGGRRAAGRASPVLGEGTVVHRFTP